VWLETIPVPPWEGEVSGYYAVPNQYGRSLRASIEITLEDVEYWLSQLGESFEQGTDVGSESIARLEALRNALKEEAKK
jgi:hypothetical protein